MDPTTLIAIAVAFLVAGTVKGGVGMGLPTVAVAIMGAALGLREAIPVLMVPSIIANIWQIMGPGSLGPLIRRFWSINLFACIGIWLGTLVLFRVDPILLSGLLGLVVCVYALINLFAVEIRASRSTEPAMSPVVGLVSGVLTGVTGSLLLPVLVYLQALGLEKDEFIQAAGLTLLVGTVVWAMALVGAGAMTGEAWLLSTLALAPTLLGMALGRWCRDRIPSARFRQGVYVLLVLLGLNLIRKALV